MSILRFNRDEGDSTLSAERWVNRLKYAVAPVLKWCVGLLLAGGLFLLFFVPRCRQVGGITWWHIQLPGCSSNTCQVEVVTWHGETVCCRFMKSPLDISVEYDGFLVLWDWAEGEYYLRYYDVKQNRFLSASEFRLLNPPQSARPCPHAAGDWHLSDLYNITGDRSCKQPWLQRVEQDFP